MPATVADAPAGTGDPRDVERLQHELRSTRLKLQATTEELQSANEELQSANEELRCSNEELLSTNEELQSANDQLHASRQELQTVNEELRRKNQAARQQARLVHLSHDAIMVRRFDGTIEAWNRGAHELYGYTHREAVGRRTHDLLATVFPRPLGEIESELRTTGSWAGELVHRTKAGRRITVLANLQLAEDEDGVVRILEANRDITERKRAEEERERLLAEVQAQKERLSALVSSMQDEIWFADLEGRFSLANPAALREFAIPGRDPVEVAALAGALEVLRPDGTPRPVEEAPPLRALRGEVISDEEELVRTPATGELRWRLVNASPVRNARGEILGSVSVVRDITRRKRSEEALRLSEEKFARAFHGNTAAMAITRLRDGVFVDVNERWVELNGHPRAEVIGRSSTGLNIWKRPEDRRGFVERLLRDGVVQGEEHRFVRRCGEEWTGLVSAQVNVLAGEPTIISSLLDVSERKRAEDALRESEERFRALFENATDAIVVGDPDEEGGIVSANPAACRLFGYSEEEFRGLSRSALVDPADPDLAAILLGLAADGHVVAELSCRRRDGTTFTGEISAAVFHDRAGRRRAVATVRDVTPRKAAEEALRETDRRRTEFLAVLSHELRNPLAPIRNSLYVLDRAAPDGDQARRARSVIGRQVEQLARLVDDLLDVTRITRGKVQLQRQRLELNDLLRHTVEDHRSLFEGDGLLCHLEPSPEPVFVQADWNRLAQVIGNLLSNAAKFTPPGGTVAISLATDPARAQAVVRVADTGIGMEPGVVERLFQPFMQADNTLDRSKGGLGLGLALVKGLVDLHGGEIHGASDGLGKGAVFTLRLPLDASGAGAERSPAAGGRSARRRVLVIEDNVDAAESLREVLAMGEHEAEVAHGGLEGVDKARSFRPDVVLCDIGLPGMDGYAVARALRADPALRDVHLVALTGYAQPEDIARATEAGFDAHLAKPPSLEKLEELLSRGRPAGKPALA